MTQATGPEVWLLLRVLLALAVVLALAFVSLRWLLPRFGPALAGLGARRHAEARLRVVETRVLDREHRLALLQVDRPTGRREVLVALASGGATFLDSWPAPDEPSGAAEAKESAP